MLNWVKRFNIFCYLDNQDYPHQDGYEVLLAVNAASYIGDPSSFVEIDQFLSSENQWCFGHLSYDLKNELHGLPGRKDKVGFPSFFFFRPQILLTIEDNLLIVQASEPDSIYQQILETDDESAFPFTSIQTGQRLTKEQYISIIEKLQKHILKGDCYEINFCQEFFAEGILVDPVDLFQRLAVTSPTPFSTLYRVNDQYLVCASPERFLKKVGNRILSQPMKGTAKRIVNDAVTDLAVKQILQQDAKEKAENVMVVDLVRNDLSQICKEATVKVDELFGVYSFPQVHQMISTVSGELKDETSFSQIIKATFPMGSMTGAPKLRVMDLIEKYEPVARGLFSGSVGYIAPNGNFDFNVVIRSAFYDSSTKYLSYSVGSGITFYSDPEKEWEECLLKAAAIKKVLTQ